MRLSHLVAIMSN